MSTIINNNQFNLTNREMEVLNYMTQGFINNEIGKSLYISEKTVKRHVTNILEKLEVTNRTLASLKAVKYNLVSLESLNI